MKESRKREAFDLQPLQEGILGVAEMHADGDTAQYLPYPSSLPYLHVQLETIHLSEGKVPTLTGSEVSGSENKPGRTQELGDMNKINREECRVFMRAVVTLQCWSNTS